MAGKSKARCVTLTHSKLTTMTKKKKHSTIIIRLISTAQTGFFYTTQRLRMGPKLSAVKYDPRGTILILPFPFPFHHPVAPVYRFISISLFSYPSPLPPSPMRRTILTTPFFRFFHSVVCDGGKERGLLRYHHSSSLWSAATGTRVMIKGSQSSNVVLISMQ